LKEIVMSNTRRSLPAVALFSALVLPSLCTPAQAQTLSVPTRKLALNAALVLTPEFCATKTKKGTWGVNQESFEIGKIACTELEPALRAVFTDVRRVDSPPSAGDQQVILTPKFGDITATQPKLAFSNRELVIQVEWTVKDKAGKTVWGETVEGTAKHHIGNAFTYKKNLKLIVDDCVKDMAEQSANKMSVSPELTKVADMHLDTAAH
jgi:hypothetical protein